MKRILITGANGLIGKNLLNSLQLNNLEIFTISRSLTTKNNLNIDLSKDWDTKIIPNNIDCIIHLAQSENFRNFPEKALDVFYTNTLSTLKLIDWAVKTGVKKFIYASSAGIYGNSDDGFNEENDIVYKNDLGFYLGTKHCSEVILDNYSKLLNVIQLRFFFVYGIGQRKDMLIPRLIENIKNKNPITLQGDFGIKINPINVSDATDAIIQSMQLEESNKFNIGGNEILSLKKIGEIIGQELNILPEFLIQAQSPKHLIGDISKMKKHLILPKISFQEGIKEYILNEKNKLNEK